MVGRPRKKAREDCFVTSSLVVQRIREIYPWDSVLTNSQARSSHILSNVISYIDVNL